MNAADHKFLALLAILFCFGLGIVFDPFDSVSTSNRAASGLILGPAAMLYSLWRLREGSFPELTDASLAKSRVKFWFCFAAFTMLGAGLTLLGADSLSGSR